MAEEVIHHVDDSSSGSSLAVGILLIFLAFIVLFLLFNRGILGVNGGGTGFQVPGRVDVNLNR